MFLFKKNQKLKELIEEFTSEIINVNSSFHTLFVENLFSDRDNGEKIEAINLIEKLADSKLHQIEQYLYTDSLLPEFREDIYSLLEEVDNIIDTYEDIAHFFYNHNLGFPFDIKDEFIEVESINCKSVNMVAECVNNLFSRASEDKITPLLKQIDEFETDVDKIEARMIRKIFTGDYSDLEKILYKDFIVLVSSISDISENVGDYVKIILMKRII